MPQRAPRAGGDPLRSLLAAVPAGAGAGYVAEVLGPILDYDRHRRTRLLQTLAVVYARQGSPRAAAAELHVHPNTVTKRLTRIGALTGADWREPATALRLQLALRLLAAESPASAARNSGGNAHGPRPEGRRPCDESDRLGGDRFRASW